MSAILMPSRGSFAFLSDGAAAGAGLADARLFSTSAATSSLCWPSMGAGLRICHQRPSVTMGLPV